MHITTQMHNMSLKSISHEGSLELRNSSILTETEVQTPQTDDQAKDLTQTPCLSRQRQLPRRLDDGASNHQFLIPEDYFHKQYFEVLDLLVCEQERSFDQESFKCLQEIEKALVESSNGTPVQLSQGFQARYASDLKFDRLSVQLSVLPDLLQTANEQHQLGINVTTISTVCQLMNMVSQKQC